MQHQETRREGSTRAADLLLEESGILVIRFKPARLDAELTGQVLQMHVELAQGQRHPTLADLRQVVSDDRAARQLATGPEARSVISKLALLVGKPTTRVIGNFLIRVARPEYPTRLFGDEALARGWLLK